MKRLFNLVIMTEEELTEMESKIKKLENQAKDLKDIAEGRSKVNLRFYNINEELKAELNALKNPPRKANRQFAKKIQEVQL